jgi:O-antigen/teichoic acid export membrane protein
VIEDKQVREQLALKSSIIGLLSKIVTIIFSFVITKIIVEYIGIEVQGINGVFSNVLGFLQLAELGIGTAITYAL